MQLAPSSSFLRHTRCCCWVRFQPTGPWSGGWLLRIYDPTQPPKPRSGAPAARYHSFFTLAATTHGTTSTARGKRTDALTLAGDGGTTAR